MRTWILAFHLAILAVFSGVGGAGAEERVLDCASALSPKSSGFDFVQCIQEVAFALDRSEREVERLQSVVADLVGTQVPSGAVVAFARKSECPDGWSPYLQGAGRVIVGVGAGNFDRFGNSLTSRKFEEPGGGEAVTLTEPQMPGHDHRVGIKMAVNPDANHGWGVINSRQNSGARHLDRVFTKSGTEPHMLEVGSTGSSQPHNNMPPYIALYFCKKD